MSSPSDGPPVPRTSAEWDRVREAKLDVLSRDPVTVDPADYPDVRPEVVTSWRRSMLAGVDPADRHYTIDDELSPRTRLAAVAQPIMERLKDEISDLNCWGFLADRACRLLTVVVGDFPEAVRVHRQNLRPGMCFGEDIVGTNGMGCAHETQQAFIISGTEHFRTDTEILTTTGVIIRDPFTNRYAGTLGAHCLREYSTAALLPLVIEIGRSIETQLLASRTDGEREFFDAFSAAERRYQGPVVGVSKRLSVVSTRARALVHEADEELLRRLAEESGAHAYTVQRQLSTGTTVRIQILPVPQPKSEFAAILVLQPVGNRVPNDAQPESNSGRLPGDPHTNFHAQLSRALDDGRPVLLAGERGCGKRYEALIALRTGADGDIVEFDCAAPHPDTGAWLGDLTTALQDPNAPVLLSHITDCPPELVATVADLIRTSHTFVVGTTIDDRLHDNTTARLQESFPVVVTVPPLRERRDEFSEICASLLADLATTPGEQPAVLTPRAAAALMAGDWPGNVRQLLQVLASAQIRVPGSAIDVQDLPARYRRNQQDPLFDEVEAAERRVLIDALRETGGDRNAAAKRLGISRATVYRKLKRYELT